MQKKLQLIQISDRFKNSAKIPLWIKQFGSWSHQLKLIRETLGMTQQQLAKLIHSTQIVVSRLESGEANPTLETMTKVANTLNCDLFISMVPRNTLLKEVEHRAEKKADAILKQTVSNAAMELQKPSRKIIEQNRRELKMTIIEKHRTSLWDK